VQDLHVSLSPLLLRSRTLPHISAVKHLVLGPALLLQASQPRNSSAQQLRFERVRASALRGKRGVADSCTARSLYRSTGVTHWLVKVCKCHSTSRQPVESLLRCTMPRDAQELANGGGTNTRALFLELVQFLESVKERECHFA